MWVGLSYVLMAVKVIVRVLASRALMALRRSIALGSSTGSTLASVP
jgi:hypothetical protein